MVESASATENETVDSCVRLILDLPLRDLSLKGLMRSVSQYKSTSLPSKRMSNVSKISHSLPSLLLRGSYVTPFSAAIPLAFAIASAMLTVPELTGLILLRSRLPELLG
jgi:hypothetical protein